MSRYRIDNVVVDTEKATNCWLESTDWDGRNQISRNTGSQWEHETLYCSQKGNYYLVKYSDWQGSLSYAEFITNEDAAKWLLHNDEELLEELNEFNILCE